jgi:type II secretory pathway component PulF
LYTPDYFPAVYVNMLRAGEASGSLQSIFERLSEYEKTRDELRGVTSSILSGAPDGGLRFHFCAALRSAEFATAFAASTAKVPPMTQFMIDLSAAVRAYGPGHCWGCAGVVGSVHIKSNEGATGGTGSACTCRY